MSEYKILCPRCPLCGGPPISTYGFNPEQMFCGDPDCPTLCWNATQSLDEQLMNVNPVNLPEDLR